METESSFLNPGKVLAASKLGEGMHVADLGAGSGFFARAAARAVGPTGVVWAVDLNRDLLVRIKNLGAVEGLKNIEILRGDLEHECGSNLPAGQFDFVIMANLLFALEQGGRECLAKEAWRVLKKGGRALVIDWRDSFDGLGPHPDHVIGQERARILFEQAGFTFIEEVPAGAYHWGFIIRKKES